MRKKYNEGRGLEDARTACPKGASVQEEDIESLLKKGRAFEAYNAADAALREDPRNVRTRQLMGLALARLGLLDRARTLMEELAGETSDIETCGILGRVYKDYWKRDHDAHYLELSVSTYEKAFREKRDGYNGINVASLSFVAGKRDEAIEASTATISYAEAWPEGYWKEATLGEAFLIIGDIASAKARYARANELGKADTGSIHSTVEQLRMLSAALPEAAEMIELFDKPVIVVFAGHMVDKPDAAVLRFPDSASGAVKAEIGSFLDRVGAKAGYSSLACGGDVLFAEALLERGLELNAVLPFGVDDFLKTSVQFAGPAWVERFRAVLGAAHSLKFTTEEGYHGEDSMFGLCSRQIMGLGILRARLFSERPWLLTLWDGAPGGGAGGTSDSVRLFPWPDRHASLNPRAFAQSGPTPIAPSPPRADGAPIAGASEFRREMKYILFSDVSGFSKLDEEKTPLFIFHYLMAISERLRDFSPAPTVVNTWGDAVFAIMDSPAALAEYAFALHDAVSKIDWARIGLPRMNLRIALHAGPVYLAKDPLIGTVNAYGTHVNRAARMEPVTAPGSIYASEPFAAALLLERLDDYRFDYAGIIELPKKFGRQEMYRISKGSRAEPSAEE